MKPKRRTEKEITAAIRGYLRTVGIFHWKVMQGLGCEKGVPDILGLYKGKMLVIEVKGPRGKLNRNQELFIDRINREGGIAFVARSVADVLKELTNIDRPLTKGG